MSDQEKDREDRGRSRSRSRGRRDRDRDRDRDRKKKKKSSRRSRSRSPDDKKSRSRSRTPPRKKKKKGGWDLRPEDIEGGVQLPPQMQNIQQSMLHGMQGGFGGGYGQVDPKKARTAYVGGLTPSLTQELLRRFFEEQLPLVAERPQVRGPAVETVSINSNGMYGFIEFYNNFDADISMCMDGMKLNGVQLQIRRPKNFQAPPTAKKYTIPGLISSRVPDGPHKIFLGGLPLNLMDAEVQGIAANFGQLSAFSLIKDRNGMSKGYAFFCYADPNLTNFVCSQLNGKEVLGKAVACKPANQKDGGSLDGGMMGGGMMGGGMMGGMGGGMMGGMGGGMMGGMPGMMGGMPGLPVSAYVQLLNMVTQEELLNDTEYKEILDDISSECGNFGRVVNLSMPRPPHPSAGQIFLQYSAPHEAAMAFQSLSGRTFSQRVIKVNYISPQQWPAN